MHTTNYDRSVLEMSNFRMRSIKACIFELGSWVTHVHLFTSNTANSRLSKHIETWFCIEKPSPSAKCCAENGHFFVSKSHGKSYNRHSYKILSYFPNESAKNHLDIAELSYFGRSICCSVSNYSPSSANGQRIRGFVAVPCHTFICIIRIALLTKII